MDQIAKLLALLVAEEENYAYVDKLGYAPSRDLAIAYIREAIRDLHSMSRKSDLESRIRQELKSLDFERLEREVVRFSEVRDRKELRELTSLIAARALCIAANLSLSSGSTQKS